MTGLERVTSRRAWFVPDFTVWGQPSLGEHEYLALEEVNAGVSIYYGTASIGENTQEVLYSQLTDHRGNALPEVIESARVFVRPKASNTAFVVGRETENRFKIAHDVDATGPVLVDLWIVELGA
jgi:hypothetical protein